MRIVAALGGNALLDPGAEPDHESQLQNVRRTARKLAGIREDGHELVITHGNGPQAGNILLQQEATPPAMPLDVVVAETQGQIGYMLQRELGNHLDTRPATILTQVEVDPDSPAFEDPSKPVGPFYTAEEAEGASGTIREVGSGKKPYRRVVPSPEPVSIIETGPIDSLLSEDGLVIASGGGGIPLTADGRGVEAVIDKDRTSSLLAQEIDADRLIILTDVEYVERGHGTDEAEPIQEMTAAEARDLAEEGEFGEGSMRPKVLAATAFVEETGREVVITSLENAKEALDGHGTLIR